MLYCFCFKALNCPVLIYDAKETKETYFTSFGESVRAILNSFTYLMHSKLIYQLVWINICLKYNFRYLIITLRSHYIYIGFYYHCANGRKLLWCENCLLHSYRETYIALEGLEPLWCQYIIIQFLHLFITCECSCLIDSYDF